MNKISYILLLSFLLVSCNSKEKADLLVYNAKVYTVDSSFSKQEAFVVKDGKFLAVGTSEDLNRKHRSERKTTSVQIIFILKK